MEEIKVSIIIPVYNTSKYLKQCLDSVINQTLQEIEIICIDDGSTDDSLLILEEYWQRDKRIKILTQKHKKQGAARNYGISIANGEYIGFVDSDDWCEPDMFEKLYKRAKCTDSDITMCAITTYNDNNSNAFSKNNTYANLDIFPKEFFNNVFSPSETMNFLMDICAYPPNKIIKRDLINSNKLKFSEKTYYEDGAFFYDCWLSAKRISLIKEFFYYYRMHSETSTCFSNDFYKIQNFRAIEDKKQILKKYNVYNSLKKTFKAYKRKSILYWFNEIKDTKAKILYMICMLFVMPSCLLEPVNILKKELQLFLKIFYSKNQKIVLWGASNFLEDFIDKYHIKNKNIVGIIDRNPAKNNKRIGNYLCYPPEKLSTLKADSIITTILNFSNSNRLSISEYLKDTGQDNITIDSI